MEDASRFLGDIGERGVVPSSKKKRFLGGSNPVYARYADVVPHQPMPVMIAAPLPVQQSAQL